ncbi:MAG: hypothetical protein WEA10_04915 [Actinomycetota bacterium]
MSPLDEVANWEIFVWSLGRLGGATEFVDVENVFIVCFELAPKRFAWRTRDDLPDYKKCAKALRDAEARRPRLLVKAGRGLKRQLTVEGQEWVRDNEQRMLATLERGKAVQEPRTRPRVRLLADVERSTTYRRWTDDGALPVHKWEVAELLRCAPDSERRIWRDRLQVLRAAANDAEKEQLLKFLDALASTYPQWFEEETA